MHFYENEALLVATLCGRIADSLESGKRVIIIATSLHRMEIESSLSVRGVDVAAARTRDQYLDLDAAHVLSKILVNAYPDAGRLAAFVGGLIAGTPVGYGGIWAFGEMVALLWTQGRHEAALRLESLWNDVARQHEFMLHCAYPAAGFSRDAGEGRLQRVCATHTPFIPAEGSSLTGYADRLRAIEELRRHSVLNRGLEGTQNLFDIDGAANGRHWPGAGDKVA